MVRDDLKINDGAAASAWVRPRLGGKFGAVTLQVPKRRGGLPDKAQTTSL
jgi:hypothetical protein